MVWPDIDTTWTRESGTSGDIVGTWKTTDESSGNTRELTFNSDGSFALTGNIVICLDDGNATNLTIKKVRSFTETVVNHPGGRPDGWYLHLKTDVEDTSGVPDNIASVSAVNLDTSTDPNTYTLSYSNGNTYKKHPA